MKLISNESIVPYTSVFIMEPHL